MIWLLPLLAAIFGPSLIFGDGAPGARRAGGGVTIPIAPPQEMVDSALPAVTRARNANAPLVVIDPGHGGRDPGATSPFGSR